MAGWGWVIPTLFCLIIMAVVVGRVRLWTRQGDGLAALILWGQGLTLCVAIWVGWALSAGGGQ